jgi:hypothetical protein
MLWTVSWLETRIKTLSDKYEAIAGVENENNHPNENIKIVVEEKQQINRTLCTNT